ncbi:unnamed protein product [Acanthoscelides obtectus]|uniref:Uncharacterized protein n=1 Tax=Acanthoscelides obtectus TaxID=200917 RepID=A0A9P0QEW9_ACAOB|nr:unnamed protein product [Acanthoscelides obtectus]CAK1629806.1 hypothetical protein AOBTE_LOCUS5966 [Acanthoscelides obtectus]
MNSLPLHNIGQYYRKRKYQDEDRGAVAPSGGHPRNHTVKHDTRGRDATTTPPQSSGNSRGAQRSLVVKGDGENLEEAIKSRTRTCD